LRERSLDIAPTLVTYNPTAGHERARSQWSYIEMALRSAGIEFDAVVTKSLLDAMFLTREAPRKYSMIIDVGSDRALDEIVNGLLRTSAENETITIGLIPLVNGDDFAKELPPKALGVFLISEHSS
jgi:diacylglycerol kinase family enzyme